MHARPAPRAQRLVSVGRVGQIPVDALPARLLAEHGAVFVVPRVRAGGAQWPARLALVSRIANVVVGLVHLPGALERVAGRAEVRAEAADVHLPHVDRGLTLEYPLGHHASDPAGPRQTVGAEAGRHEEAPHLALAETELVVRRERLRPVDQARDL